MTDRELMQMALDALENACGNRCNREYNPCLQREAAEAIRAALAQPESDGPTPSEQYAFERGFQRARQITSEQWQGLTDEEIEDACWTEVDQRLRSFARAIEAKLKAKNA